MNNNWTVLFDSVEIVALTVYNTWFIIFRRLLNMLLDKRPVRSEDDTMIDEKIKNIFFLFFFCARASIKIEYLWPPVVLYSGKLKKKKNKRWNIFKKKREVLGVLHVCPLQSLSSDCNYLQDEHDMLLCRIGVAIYSYSVCIDDHRQRRGKATGELSSPRHTTSLINYPWQEGGLSY